MEESKKLEVKISVDAYKKNVPHKHPGMPRTTPVFVHGDVIKGKLNIKLLDQTTPITHKGIQVSIIGRFEGGKVPNYLDPFFVKNLQLLPASKLSQSLENISFNFDRVSFPLPSYYGTGVNVAYYVECKVDLSPFPNVTRKPFYFVKLSAHHEDTPLHKGIGITNVLHMDVILKSTTVDPRVGFIGYLYFALFKIRMVSVSFEVVRVESNILGGYLEKTDEKLQSFEIMDGAPVKGTAIPIRMFTGGMNIWPNPKDSKFSVEYFLRVHAVDETGSLYVKNIPINFVFCDNSK
ncbi:Vacuolar protein sorting-associated protein 26 [Tritrichomonas foetus]|uniref:Vacuolar protein sorting-associated protein 26 n=1 Tax=Tritrichomonas foetus TaxID=1144522 RepID=A0A1J4KBR4_9EUKA|nr:Vacuolar protein sorting-associated protein 26 [Tritrichomonas foetus]|eukprot:OHT08847.1 Vacuolar protein sorting-associated protein 26 [Tritrichomonas foetus]